MLHDKLALLFAPICSRPLLTCHVFPQDQPDQFGDDHPPPEVKAQFEHELATMIAQHLEFPSIIAWVVFNEGWGQYDTERIVNMTKHLDPTRLADCASGWNDAPVRVLGAPVSFQGNLGTTSHPAVEWALPTAATQGKSCMAD